MLHRTTTMVRADTRKHLQVSSLRHLQQHECNGKLSLSHQMQVQAICLTAVIIVWPCTVRHHTNTQ
jgi:hypothetical protein